MTPILGLLLFLYIYSFPVTAKNVSYTLLPNQPIFENFSVLGIEKGGCNGRGKYIIGISIDAYCSEIRWDNYCSDVAVLFRQANTSMKLALLGGASYYRDIVCEENLGE